MGQFEYPVVGVTDEEKDIDWREYPRNERSSDISTMAVDPRDTLGWFVAHNRKRGLAFGYVWNREDFPWLVNWEENCAREDKPWNGRTLCRGLEFSSYAMPTSRKENVERGSLFGVPCFEWLDAYETKETRFWMTLKPMEADTVVFGEDGESTSLLPGQLLPIPRGPPSKL